MSIRGMIICVYPIVAAGCAHTQLATNVQRQSTTLSDIQEQQVLDNIAMFCANPGATPFFAVPTGGGTAVNRTHGGQFGLNWNATTLTGVSAGGNANQTNLRSWTLQAINDPVQLGLMKAVYKRVTCTNSNHCDCSCHASDCKLRNYFGNDLTCKTPNCWFHVGDRPPCGDDCCVKVGEYCGTYVWVEKPYFECLSQVTLSILDIATADATRLARANGTPEKTVDIEQSFVLTNGQTIKGSYAISATDYEKLQKEERFVIPRRAATDADIGAAIDTKQGGAALKPVIRDEAGGHLRGNGGDLLNQLILQQGTAR